MIDDERGPCGCGMEAQTHGDRRRTLNIKRRGLRVKSGVLESKVLIGLGLRQGTQKCDKVNRLRFEN